MADIEIEKNKLVVEDEVHKAYLNKLKGRLYGLLCEREKNRDWEKCLENILIELYNLPQEYRTINYESLVCKLGMCKFLRFQYFRTTIMSCMNLISAMEE